MPTYDYVCRSCEHEFEAFQSMSARPMKKCPACGKMQLKRLIGTGAGIIFKGSGFYETDYRSSEYRQKAKQESQGTGSSSGDGGGGDSASTNSSKGDSQASGDSGSTSSDSGAGKNTGAASGSESGGSTSSKRGDE